MNTLICAGGTGTRVLEAVLHLCAAGLGPETLRLLVVDPDRSNGNGDRTSSLVDRYREGHRRFARHLGADLRLFRTELDLLEVGREAGLKVWSPVSTTDRLHDLLHINLLSAAELPEDLWQLFFTRQELAMDLREGFRARPSVGAAAMSLVELHAEEQPWKLLVERLENDTAVESGARVFLAGSIFGGTGASALFPIGRFLRDQVRSERLRLAAALLSPYFRFAAAAADPSQPAVPDAARSEDFPTHTRGAASLHVPAHPSHSSPPFSFPSPSPPFLSPTPSPGGPSMSGISKNAGIALAATASLALLATACTGQSSAGANDDPDARTTITFWHGWSQESETKAIGDNVAAFEKLHPNIHVKVVGNIADDKSEQALRAGGADAPDVVSSFTTDNVGTFCSAKVWADLNPFLRKDGVDPAKTFPAAMLSR